jgi:hypothetical protein
LGEEEIFNSHMRKFKRAPTQDQVHKLAASIFEQQHHPQAPREMVGMGIDLVHPSLEPEECQGFS